MMEQHLIGAFALLAVVPAAWSQDAGTGPCRKLLNERIGQCANEEIARPGRNPSDFSFWQTCRAKYEPEYQRCLQASNRPPQPGGELATSDPENPRRPMNEAIFTFPQKTSSAESGKKARVNGKDSANTAERAERRCPWPEARLNIDWVMSHDAGARRTFMQAREGGLSCYDAVLAAQRHNSNAQSTIRACGPRSAGYINSQPLCLVQAASRPEKPAAEGESCVGPPQERRDTSPHCAKSVEIAAVNHCATMKDIYICLKRAGGVWGCSAFANIPPGQGASDWICDPGTYSYNVQSRPAGSSVRFQMPRY